MCSYLFIYFFKLAPFGQGKKKAETVSYAHTEDNLQLPEFSAAAAFQSPSHRFSSWSWNEHSVSSTNHNQHDCKVLITNKYEQQCTKTKCFARHFPRPCLHPSSRVGRDVAQIQLIKRLLREETGVTEIRYGKLTQFYRRAMRAHH